MSDKKQALRTKVGEPVFVIYLFPDYIYFNLYIKYALYAIGVHHNTNYEKM